MTALIKTVRIEWLILHALIDQEVVNGISAGAMEHQMARLEKAIAALERAAAQ